MREKRTRLLPKELQELLNLSFAKCPKCDEVVICSFLHIKTHGFTILSCEEIEERTTMTKREKLKTFPNKADALK